MARLGKGLDLSEQDLDELAEITSEDIERVNERWSKVVSQFIRNILLTNQPD